MELWKYTMLYRNQLVFVEVFHVLAVIQMCRWKIIIFKSYSFVLKAWTAAVWTGVDYL